MAKQKHKWLVLYNQNCSLKWKEFDEKADALMWIGIFILGTLQNREDNWVDALIEGTLIHSSFYG